MFQATHLQVLGRGMVAEHDAWAWRGQTLNNATARRHMTLFALDEYIENNRWAHLYGVVQRHENKAALG